MAISTPSILKEISDVVGTDGMIALVRARGGTRVYIPAKMTGSHWLARILGFDAAHKLSKHFAQSNIVESASGPYRIIWRGCAIELPLFRDKKSIESETGGSLATAEAAILLGVTQRTIFRRRARQSSERP